MRRFEAACDLAAKVIDEPENQADGQADEQAGGDREIKRAVFAAVNDISWQTAETEGQFTAEIEQGANGDQGSAERQKNTAELSRGFHTGIVAPN